MSFLTTLVLSLQFCLGLWQICKLTPLGGLITAIVLRWWLPFSIYNQLKEFEGKVIKTCRAGAFLLVEQRQPRVGAPPPQESSISLRYLGKEYMLQKIENQLFINGSMSYYITNVIWDCLLDLSSLLQRLQDAGLAPFIFLKGHKEFWDDIVSGGVIELDEVLDSIILDRLKVIISDHDWFLPVNLSGASEEKLLKLLNMVGLLLEVKEEANAVIATSMSLVSATLEFSTPLRVAIYSRVNFLFCKAMQFICDRLPYYIRKRVYSLGNWVENLKPSNDLRSKVIKGDVKVLVSGGAKFSQDASLDQVDHVELGRLEDGWKRFGPDKFYIQLRHDQLQNLCHVRASDGTIFSVPCAREEAQNVQKLVHWIVQHRAGSLKTCVGNVVHLRGWKESLRHYSEVGFPALHELQLSHVTIL